MEEVLMHPRMVHFEHDTQISAKGSGPAPRRRLARDRDDAKTWAAKGGSGEISRGQRAAAL